MTGSRRDHYEAATDFWRVMQEIMERRFRWNLRQVMAAVDETRRALDEGTGKRGGAPTGAAAGRLDALAAFAAAVDAALRAFAEGQVVAPEHVRRSLQAVPIEGGDAG